MEQDRILIGEPLPQVSSVKATAGYRLHIVWADGSETGVDLSGVLARFEPFAALRDEKMFGTAKPVDRGLAIEWDNGLDYAAVRLREIADIQAEAAVPMDAESFKDWMKAARLTVPEAADFFGMGERQIKNYRAGSPIPRVVSILARQTARDQGLLHALATR